MDCIYLSLEPFPLNLHTPWGAGQFRAHIRCCHPNIAKLIGRQPPQSMVLAMQGRPCHHSAPKEAKVGMPKAGRRRVRFNIFISIRDIFSFIDADM